MNITINEFTQNDFSDIIKRLVNSGYWGLYYGYSDSDDLVKYQLRTGKHFYLMGENGRFISVNDSYGDFNYKDLVFFAD